MPSSTPTGGSPKGRSRSPRCRVTSMRRRSSPRGVPIDWASASARVSSKASAVAARGAFRGRLLVRGYRHLRARARRRQASLSGRDLERRPGSDQRHCACRPRRAASPVAHGAEILFGLGRADRGDRDAPRYNPMSYHNGSIWPHDNAMIATGLALYGRHRGGDPHFPGHVRCRDLHGSAPAARIVLRLSAVPRPRADALSGRVFPAGLGERRLLRAAAGVARRRAGPVRKSDPVPEPDAPGLSWIASYCAASRPVPAAWIFRCSATATTKSAFKSSRPVAISK